MPSKPCDIDTYLARVPEDKREALERLRRQILAAAPGAQECIAWQMPSFRHEGRLLVCFGAARRHCSLYPMSASVIADHEDLLTKHDTSKGTIRFQPDKPLPAALVRKLVKARIAENRAKGAVRRGARS